jgi:hypothetical protein
VFLEVLKLLLVVGLYRKALVHHLVGGSKYKQEENEVCQMVQTDYSERDTKQVSTR